MNKQRAAACTRCASVPQAQRTNRNQQKDPVSEEDENARVTFHEDSKTDEENGVGIETTLRPLQEGGST